MIDVCIGFFAILAPFWEPSWGHVVYFFNQNWAALWGCSPLFCCIGILFHILRRFGPILTPFWFYFGHRPMGYPPPCLDFCTFLNQFWYQVGPAECAKRSAAPPGTSVLDALQLCPDPCPDLRTQSSRTRSSWRECRLIPLILPKDPRIPSGRPSWCTRGARRARLGRPLGETVSLQEAFGN